MDSAFASEENQNFFDSRTEIPKNQLGNQSVKPENDSTATKICISNYFQATAKLLYIIILSIELLL